MNEINFAIYDDIPFSQAEINEMTKVGGKVYIDCQLDRQKMKETIDRRNQILRRERVS